MNKLAFDDWLIKTYPDLYNHCCITPGNIYNHFDVFYLLEIMHPCPITSNSYYNDIAKYVSENEHLHEFWML